MSRKDKFHQVVKYVLEKEGWVITHDPFTIQITETVRLQIDLGAETTIEELNQWKSYKNTDK